VERGRRGLVLIKGKRLLAEIIQRPFALDQRNVVGRAITRRPLIGTPPKLLP
jgi:hypothetical protein